MAQQPVRALYDVATRLSPEGGDACEHIAQVRGGRLDAQAATVRVVPRIRRSTAQVGDRRIGLWDRDNRYRATIPPTYTDSHFPLQYYFEIQHAASSATLYPGLGPELNNQPYFVVRRA